MKALTIKTIEREYPNQWVLVEVIETKNGAPHKGVLLKAGKRRQDILEEIGKHKQKKLFLFFSGISAPADTAFAL
jgi:hypothetical protein